MTFKLRSVAAAVALAISASGAQAELITGQLSSDAELFFIAFDPTTNHTLVKDLGISFSTLAANSASTSWFTAVDLGAQVTTGSGSGAFNFGNGVLWSLAAGRVKTVSGSSNSANNGVFASVDLNNTNAASLTLQPAGTSLNTANGVLSSLRTVVTGKAAQLNNGFTPGTENTVLGQDGSFFVANTPALEWAFEPGWGENFNLQSSIDSTGEIGITEALAFYHWYLETGSPTAVKSEAQAGLWRLSQAGVLSYSAPAPVPVPPALWLLGSAFASLGIARRRKAAAA